MMRWIVIAAVLLLPICVVGTAHADLLSEAIQDYQFQDLEQSETKLRRVLQQNPRNLMAHYYLGAVLQQQGKIDEAITHFEEVANSEQPIAGIQDALAAAYIAAGKGEKALPYLEKKYQQNAADDNVSFQYAVALQASGSADKATEIYQRLIDSKSLLADQARFQLGQILVSYGAYTSAVETMKPIEPNSPYGAAAKNYMDALKPVTRPFSIYVSAEGFYHDNPGSTSSSTLGIASAFTGGSQGLTLIGSLNTRALEATQRLHLKLGYLYYGTFYRVAGAKQFNFVGHFVNPSMIYKFSPSTDLELKGDIQFYYFGQQKLSTNVGGTATLTYRSAAGNSLNAHLSYLDKKYSKSFLSSGILTSLEYLNARATGIGAGTTLTSSSLVKDWNASLSLDYTYNDEKPKNTGSTNATLAAKSLDSRYKEHAVRANLTLPFGLGSAPISLLANASYSYRDFSNIQSANTYASAAGLHMKSAMLVAGAKLQVVLLKDIGLTFGIGGESTISHSHASELTYKANRYYATLSAAY